MAVRFSFWSITLVLIAALLSVVEPARADDPYPNQAAAYAACLAFKAQYGSGFASCAFSFTSDPTGLIGYSAACPGGNPGRNYTGGYSPGYDWCTAPTCAAGTSPGGQTDYSMNDPGGVIGSGAPVDQGGCCATLDLNDPNYRSAWSAADKSDATATGHFVLNGSRCYSNLSGSDTGGQIPNPPHLAPFPYCPKGVTGCYNTFKDAFCAQTQSGEWNCIPRNPTNDPGGCISGATGSECYSKNGNPVPAPPDPPIQKGTPPDVTNNYTITNTSTTNNYTSSSYSGTSPGPGPASGSSSSSSVSPGGTGSNSSGSGNSGKSGTDSTGKCANGSVPTASGCSGTYRDDGCDHPPACFGDAVLCGIAANTHKAACNPSSGTSVGSPSSALAAAGVPADGGASGDPSASGLVTSSDLGSDGFDSSGLGFSRSCPANPTFNVLGHSYTLDLTPFCNFAGMLGWFVLLISYLAGLRIVATGKA